MRWGRAPVRQTMPPVSEPAPRESPEPRRDKGAGGIWVLSGPTSMAPISRHALTAGKRELERNAQHPTQRQINVSYDTFICRCCCRGERWGWRVFRALVGASRGAGFRAGWKRLEGNRFGGRFAGLGSEVFMEAFWRGDDGVRRFVPFARQHSPDSWFRRDRACGRKARGPLICRS